MKKLYLVLVLIFISVQFTNAQGWLKKYQDQTGEQKTELNFNEIQSWAKSYFQKTEKEIRDKQSRGESIQEGDDKRFSHYIKYKRWEWYWSTRILDDGSLGGPSQWALKSHIAGKRQNQAKMSKSSTASGWQEISHMNKIDNNVYWGMGRSECMAFHPSDVNTFYVGAVGGGIFKTTNGGTSYTAVGDDLPITQVSSIVVDHQNPNTVYVALSPRYYYANKSMGVYKSTDSGATWNPTGLANDYSAADSKWIEEIVMSPSNSSILLAARADGIYRTTNGGSTWTKVHSTGVNDIEWSHAVASNTVYATEYDYWGTPEVIKSTDAGLTWSAITNKNLTQNRLKIALTPADSNVIVYYSQNESDAIYVSTNGGTSFTKKASVDGGIYWYYPIFISPTNASVFYNGSVDLWRSTDQGTSFSKITSWNNTGAPKVMHADISHIYHSPVDTNILFVCTDGGVFKYNESTEVWTDLTDGLRITRYYRIAVSPYEPYVVMAGSQDNGGKMRKLDGTWRHTNGGDAMEQAIDPNSPNIVFSTYTNGLLYRSTDAWSTNTDISSNITGGKPAGDWVAPYQLDPNNSSTIIAGYDDVYKSTDRGDTWIKISNNIAGGNTLKQLKVAPSNSSVIYCSYSNNIYKTTDGGTNWSTHTIPSSKTITRIEVDHQNTNRLWVTVSGWTVGEKIYQSTDGGVNWTNLSDNLPNVPTNCLIYERGTNEGIYVGNDIGVYYKDNTMNDWINYSTNLPNTVVTDLEINISNRELVAGTYGRGVWKTGLYDQSISNLDCNGDAGGSATVDDCFTCSGGNTGVVRNSTCDYCVASGLVTGNPYQAPDHITNVTYGAVNNDSGFSGYTDYRNLSSTYASGASISLDVKIDYAFAGTRVYVWVDWDNNMSFDDDERVDFPYSSYPGWNKIETASITVPNGTTNGNYVMRIRASQHQSTNPCGESIGEVEDYTVVVSNPTYTLTVVNGTGDGDYEDDTSVNIVADSAPVGQEFDKWELTSGTAVITDVNASSTTVTTAAGVSTVTALYKNIIYACNTTIQSEVAVNGNGGFIDSRFTGYNGSGVYNFPANGGYVEFNVNGCSAGLYTLTYRYALGDADKTGALLVNGVSKNLTMTGTGSWSNYTTGTVDIVLTSGSNTIRFQSTGQDFGNFDEISLSASCEGTIQAESATYGNGGFIDTRFAGFNGTGVYNFPANGGYVEFAVNGCSTGLYTLTYRYALGDVDKTGALLVNGVSQNLTMTGTGSWSNYATGTVDVVLTSGSNTIRFQSSGQDFGNLDQVSLSASCEGTIQAESATYGNGGFIDSRFAGYNGSGVYNFPANGGYVEFAVNSCSTGLYTLTYRYALGDVNKTGALLVNGVSQNLIMTGTGSWSNYATGTVDVTLTNGSNTIRFQSSGQDFGNLDEISLAASCEGTVQAEDITYGGGGFIDSRFAGYNGSGCYNYPASGGYVEYSINGCSPGLHTLTYRYALGDVDKTGSLIVNGVSQNLTMTGTGGWSNYTTGTVDVTLTSGSNTIRFQSSGQDFGNLDQINLSVKASKSLEVEQTKYNSDFSFKVYPNPIKNGYLNIKVEDGKKISKLEIFDLTGRLVYMETKLKESDEVINLTNLKSAMYFLNVHIDGVVKSKKIIVK